MGSVLGLRGTDPRQGRMSLRTRAAFATKILILCAVLGAQPTMTVAAGIVPLTGLGDSEAITGTVANRSSNLQPLPTLDEFVSKVADNRGERVVGVYVPDVLALRVLQQPSGNPGFVTSAPDAVSQFGLAAEHGTIGILAHNYLSGDQFFRLAAGQSVVVVRADGTRERFRIDSVHRYRALSPSSAVSDFIELDDQGRRVSALELFNQMYASEGQLVFQTCIARDGNLYWGRLFVVATPLEVGPTFQTRAKIHRL